MRSNRLHCAVFSYVTGHSNLALRTRIGISGIAGMEQVTTDIPTKTVHLRYYPDQVSLPKIPAKIRGKGSKGKQVHEGSPTSPGWEGMSRIR